MTMSLTSFAIILTIFILQIHHVGPRQRRMSAWLRTFAFEYLARFLCVRNIVHNFLKDVSLEDAFEKFPRPATTMDTPDLVCSYIMELTALNQRRSSSVHLNGSVGGTTTTTTSRDTSTSTTATKRSALENFIAAQIKNNAKYKRQKEEQKAIGDEWRLLAIILDRLFFWIYIAITMIASIGILLLMPAMGDWFETKRIWS